MQTSENGSLPRLSENLSSFRADVLAEGRRTRRHILVAAVLILFAIYASGFVALNAVFGRPWF